MASIRVRGRQGKRVVTVRGRLAAADLRRLELACGSALEHREVPLEIELKHISGMDEAAERFLDLLARRGAELRSSEAPSRAARLRTTIRKET